eukprot:gnl/TRDRNA2_/TRDRNA2_168960_c0_seq1.p1 gnl/TRDRNA2_/TRDRNA2_168960_c0~~gnl/TRDRNA2_/TRDRNA2_168960_c0_seq1.p1  ORF type:complete len:257 (-),score=9.75 gnl/TRDRNA2_/TRDRNA2_168960_c0_seq1:368-1138(-)
MARVACMLIMFALSRVASAYDSAQCPTSQKMGMVGMCEDTPCKSDMGPTDCTDGFCICQSGYCARGFWELDETQGWCVERMHGRDCNLMSVSECINDESRSNEAFCWDKLCFCKFGYRYNDNTGYCDLVYRPASAVLLGKRTSDVLGEDQSLLGKRRSDILGEDHSLPPQEEVEESNEILGKETRVVTFILGLVSACVFFAGMAMIIRFGGIDLICWGASGSVNTRENDLNKYRPLPSHAAGSAAERHERATSPDS